MARQPNQFYQDPTAEIGSNLVTALFGDPRARAAQQQQQAEMDARAAQAEEARAHARLYGAQATGADTANTANTGLPELFANLYKTVAPVAPRAPMGAESDDAGEIPGTPGVTAEQSFKSNLPNLIASLAQSGYGANVGNFTQAAAAFAGGDDLARRALISDGHVPGKDFSLSPQRDDAIAARDSSAKLLEAMGVARINHANDIPVANIRAGASRDVALTNNRDDIAVAQIGANSRVDAAGVRGGSSLGRLVSSLYPSARLTSGDRSQAQQNALIARSATGAVRSYHVPGNGGQAIDMAPVPGKSLAQVVQELRANGADVIEAKDETAPGQGTGPHWHIAVRDTGKQSAWAKAPPKLSSADDKSVEHALALLWNATTMDGGGSTPQPSFSAIDLNGPSKTLLKARTADLLQSGGNVASAAQQATREYWAAVRANGGKVAAWRPGQPISAARSAWSTVDSPTLPMARPTTSAVQRATKPTAPQDQLWVRNETGKLVPWSNGTPVVSKAKAKGNPTYPDAKRGPDGNLYVEMNKPGEPVKYGMVPG